GLDVAKSFADNVGVEAARAPICRSDRNHDAARQADIAQEMVIAAQHICGLIAVEQSLHRAGKLPRAFGIECSVSALKGDARGWQEEMIAGDRRDARNAG